MIMDEVLEIEDEIRKKGFKYTACIDEVGRGCLAGSVVACAVIMPEGLRIEGVDDSKKLSPKKRDKLYDVIIKNAIAVGIGQIDCKKIDEVNIKNATKLAMKQAIENLRDKAGNKIIPDHLLIDAEKLDLATPQTNVIKGDARCHGIAAASIVAKVTRDRQMESLSNKYPEYNFAKNKGYGTKEHVTAILEFGTCEIHRRTFLKKILGEGEQLTMPVCEQEA